METVLEEPDISHEIWDTPLYIDTDGLPMTPTAPGDALAAGRANIAPELIDPNPYQPRREFAEEEIAQLAQSISRRLLNHPTVRPHPDQPGRFQMVDGERRLRAVKYLNLDPLTPYGVLPCIVEEVGDQEMLELAMDADAQHKHFNPIERAWGFAKMEEMGTSQEEIARRYNTSQSAVSNQVRLLKLPDATTPVTTVGREPRWNDVQGLVARGELSQAHGIELCSLADDPEAVRDFAQKAVEGGWTQKALNEEIRAYQSQQEREKAPALFEPEADDASEPETGDEFQVGDLVQWGTDGKLSTGTIAEVGNVLYFVQPTGTEGARKRREFKKDSSLLHPWDGKPVIGKPRIGGKFHAVELPPNGQQPEAESTPPAETQSTPACRECRHSEAEVQAAGAHMTKFDLCSRCDLEYQAAQSEARAEDARAEEDGNAPAKAANAGDKAANAAAAPAKAGSKASTLKASTPKASTPAAPKVPEGFTATFVPTEDTNFIQAAGISVPAAITAVRKLLEMGEPLGLHLDDMIATIENYFNDEEGEA